MNEILDIYEQLMESMTDINMVALATGLLAFIAFYFFTKE